MQTQARTFSPRGGKRRERGDTKKKHNPQNQTTKPKGGRTPQFGVQERTLGCPVPPSHSWGLAVGPGELFPPSLRARPPSVGDGQGGECARWHLTGRKMGVRRLGFSRVSAFPSAGAFPRLLQSAALL